MSKYSEDDLFDLSDEELEAAMREAKAQTDSPETEIEEDTTSSAEDESVEYEEDGEEGSDDSEEFDEDEDSSEDDADTVNESNEDDSEQPDGDSDHDASEDDEAEADSEEDSDKSDKDNPDGDSEDGEEDSEEEGEGKEDSQKTQRYTFKANGQEYEFTTDEIMEHFPKVFGQAMDYTKKMQAIKPWRKTIDAIEQAGLQHDDVNLAIDVLNGDKDALSEVLKRKGIDALDLDTEESNYVAKDYGRDENTLDVADVIKSIEGDEKFETTRNILAKGWDDSSYRELTSNPELIRLLHTDVQNGMYDTIQPIANKLKVYGGNTKSDLEYYKEAAQQYFGQLEQQRQAGQVETDRLTELEKAQATEEKRLKELREERERLEKLKQEDKTRKEKSKKAAKRKAAAPTTNRVDSSTTIDYLDDSDEGYDKWYKEVMDGA